MKQLLAATTLALAPLCALAQSTTLAIPVLSLTFTPNYLAEEKGYWKEEGLEVKFMAIPGVQATNAVLAGSVDFTNTTASAFLRANARGQKLVAIANTIEKVQIEIVVSKAFADKVAYSPNAPLEKRLAALKGARMAVDAVNSIVHGYVLYGAKKGGIDGARDITVSPMAPPAMLAALKSGQVDGFAMSRPWSSMARRDLGAVSVASSPAGDFPELHPFNYNVIIAKPETCPSKPEVCRKLVNGFKKAMRLMHEQPDEAIAILRKRFEKTDPAVLEDAFRGVLAGTPRTPLIQEAGFARVEDYMIAAGIMKAEERLPSYTGVYTNDYAR